MLIVNKWNKSNLLGMADSNSRALAILHTLLYYTGPTTGPSLTSLSPPSSTPCPCGECKAEGAKAVARAVCYSCMSKC